MSALESALVTLARHLDEEEVPYMVIGGLANAVWGEPRATLDIDVTVWVEEPRIADFVTRLAGCFETLAEEPIGFARETRVIPLVAAHGVRADVILGLLPFEREAIARSVNIAVHGRPIRFATAEDLILMKIISQRDRDLEDARGIAARRMSELDLSYLEPRIDELSRVLERPEIGRLWRRWKQGSEP